MRPAIVSTSDVELKVTSERDCMNQHSWSKKRKERQVKNRLHCSSFPRCSYSSRAQTLPLFVTESSRRQSQYYSGCSRSRGLTGVCNTMVNRHHSGHRQPPEQCQALGPPPAIRYAARENTHHQPLIQEITGTGTEYRAVVLDQGGHMPRHAKLPLSIKNASGQAENMFCCKGIVTSLCVERRKTPVGKKNMACQPCQCGVLSSRFHR